MSAAFIAILATFCHLTGEPQVEVCEQVTVTDSNQDDSLTMHDCQAQDHFVKFMQEHPIYHNWRMAKYGCTIGNKPPLDNKHDKA